MDAECDRQATVVSRLFRLLLLEMIDVPLRNYSQFRGWEKLQTELRLFFEIFEFRICFINILQLQGALYLDQKL